MKTPSYTKWFSHRPGETEGRAFAGITFSDATIPQSFAYNGYCDQLTDSIRVNTTGFPIEENYAIYGRSSGYIRTASSEKRAAGDSRRVASHSLGIPPAPRGLLPLAGVILSDPTWHAMQPGVLCAFLGLPR